MMKRSFTLIELMVVIAIIAILAAVLVPTIVNLTDKAKVSKLLAVADTLSTACASFHMDTGNYAVEYAAPWYRNHSQHQLSFSTGASWNGPYIKSPLSRADNPFNNRILMYNRTNGWESSPGGQGFDLTGDGHVDTVGGGNVGNDVVFYGVPRTIAPMIETDLDGTQNYSSGKGEYRSNYYYTIYLGGGH